MLENKKYPLKFCGKIYLVDKLLYDEYYRTQRKIKYFENDLKTERIIVDEVNQNVVFVPAREDSYDRLLDKGAHFSDDCENIEDIVVRTVMAERLSKALNMLAPDERQLIQAIFYERKSERNCALKCGISQPAIHKRKAQILDKLRKIIEE